MPETEDTTETEAQIDDQQQDVDLGDAGKKAIDAERDARKTAEKQARESKKAAEAALARVKEFEDRDKTETQKSAERIAELERALADKDTVIADKDTVIAAKDREAERAKVAAAKGVPANLVTGSTLEEMEASAEAALDWAGTGRKPIGALRSGASASNSADPKERAAQAIRSMWQNK